MKPIREGLALFSRDVQETAEQRLRQKERISRHAKGETDDMFLQKELNSIRAGFSEMTRLGTKDRAKLRTALQNLGSRCHECADLISETEESPI